MLGLLLQTSASLLNALSQTGGRIYPFPLFMAAHAARISIVFRSKVRGNSTGGKLSWPADLFGFLTFAWGGMFLGSGLLGQVPPNLLALEPWIAYLSVHIFISSILYFVPVEINHPLMDVCLFWLDAATKSGAIFGAIAGCSNHPNTLVQQSTFAPIVLSALAPVGGGTVAHMFCVHEQNWGFTSPPWLKPGNGILSTLDMWTAAVAAIMYGILTQSHPSYEPWREFLGLPSKGAFTVLGARSAVVSFLMVAYGLRAVYLYVPKASSRIKKNDNKEKGSSIKKRSEKIQ